MNYTARKRTVSKSKKTKKDVTTEIKAKLLKGYSVLEVSKKGYSYARVYAISKRLKQAGIGLLPELNQDVVKPAHTPPVNFRNTLQVKGVVISYGLEVKQVDVSKEKIEILFNL